MKKTIKELRLEQGISQWQMAVKVGCRPETISNIENGVLGTTVKTLTAICKVLGVEPHDVTGVTIRKQTGQHKWTVVEEPFDVSAK